MVTGISNGKCELPIVLARSRETVVEDFVSALTDNEGKTFVFLEPGQKADERFGRRIAAEYRLRGRHFLVSAGNDDNYCGVYGQHARVLIPKGLKIPPRDWILKHFWPLAGETNLFEDAGRPEELSCGGSGYNLATWQARYAKCPQSDEELLAPWVTAKSSAESKGRAVFARSERYQNPKFPWGQIVRQWPAALFIGLPDEYMAFQEALGSDAEYRPTSNLLEVAELIAGSEIFVGNQSCPFWIAAALGHRLIQETDQWNLNSCVDRPNAEYRL